jgi:hypothetical protein
MKRQISYNPKVSLDPKVHYTTAGSSYDRLLDNGPLTDEKILEYQAEGKLCGTGPDATKRQLAARAVLEERRRKTFVRVKDALAKAKKKQKLQKQLEAYE